MISETNFNNGYCVCLNVPNWLRNSYSELKVICQCQKSFDVNKSRINVGSFSEISFIQFFCEVDSMEEEYFV